MAMCLWSKYAHKVGPSPKQVIDLFDGHFDSGSIEEEEEVENTLVP
jgi:hypothetical protein